MTKVLPRWITDGAQVFAYRSAQRLLPSGNGSPTHVQSTRSGDEIIWRSTKSLPVAYAYQRLLPLARKTNGSGKSRSCGPLGIDTTTAFAATPVGAGPGAGGAAVVVVVVDVVDVVVVDVVEVVVVEVEVVVVAGR